VGKIVAKKSDVLRNVKSRLWDGKEALESDFMHSDLHRRFICLVIEFEMAKVYTKDLIRTVTKDIRTKLTKLSNGDTSATYEDIIELRIGAVGLKNMPTEDIQKERQAFLDMMIENYEKDGD
jgi:hypothetical protein